MVISLPVAPIGAPRLVAAHINGPELARSPRHLYAEVRLPGNFAEGNIAVGEQICTYFRRIVHAIPKFLEESLGALKPLDSQRAVALLANA